MWSRDASSSDLKSADSIEPPKNIWLSFIKSKLIPFLVALGRTISCIGSGLFALDKFFEWLQNGEEEDSKLKYYLSIILVVCALIIQMATRIPKIYRQFNPIPPPGLPPRETELLTIEPDDNDFEPNDEIPEIPESSSVESVPINAEQELRVLGIVVYATLSILTIISSLMTIPSNYLNTHTFVKFTLAQQNIDANEGAWDYFTRIFCAYIALTSFINYLIYTVQPGLVNSRKAAIFMQDGKNLRDKAIILTAIVAAIGTFTVPFQARFSTQNALDVITGGLQSAAAKLTINCIATFSGVTATASNLTVQVHPVYKRINHYIFGKPPENEVELVKKCWVPPVSMVVWTAGIANDFVSFALSNIVSVARIVEELTPLDAKSPPYLAVNIGFSAFNALLNVSYSTFDGWENTLKDYLPKKPPAADRKHLLSQLSIYRRKESAAIQHHQLESKLSLEMNP